MSFILLVAVSACQGMPTPPTSAPPSSTAARPAAWAALGLTGRLVVAQISAGLWTLDLETSERATIYQPLDPAQEWINAAAVAPNSEDVVVALAPRPGPGEVQFGYTELWRLTLTGGAPQPFVQRQDPRESFFSPDWTADGSAVVYGHLTRATPPGSERPVYGYQIEERSLTAAESVVRVADAYWPRLSAAGGELAYVAFSPTDAADTGLYLTSGDTAQSQRLSGADVFSAVDAPLILSRERAVLFSAPTPPAVSGRSRLPQWFARPRLHNVASDWWLLQLEQPDSAIQVTHLGLTGLHAAESPDGAWVAFISDAGLYVMRPDGRELTRLLALTASGTVDWIP